MVPSLAISRNAPLPPSLYLSLCLIPPPPFFYRLFLAPRSLPPPPSHFRVFLLSSSFAFPFLFLFSLSLSFFHRDACFLHRSFCPVREHLKKEKWLHEKTPEEGVRGFDSTKVREESNPLPLFCRRWRAPPPQKNVSALLKTGDARHRRKTIAFGTANNFVSLSRYFSRYP